jgi:NADH dehydrogenase FAD-containing subunit
VIGSQNIYAIGDLAYMETPNYPQGHPQVATTAIQQAKLLADNLLKIKAAKLILGNMNIMTKAPWQRWEEILQWLIFQNQSCILVAGLHG